MNEPDNSLFNQHTLPNTGWENSNVTGPDKAVSQSIWSSRFFYDGNSGYQKSGSGSGEDSQKQKSGSGSGEDSQKDYDRIEEQIHKMTQRSKNK